MILDELAQLKRFRRIAQNHELTPSEENMLPHQEIEYLRGLINAKIYLEAKPWMCPSWVLLSLKDLDIENKLVTEYHNSMYRNWSNIGGVGCRRHGIADSRGLVTPRFDCGSIDFWLLDNEELVFPAMIGKDGPQLRLISTEDQLYEWNTQIKAVEFTRLVYHVSKDNSEYIHNEIILRNHGLEQTTFTFYATVRPMSPLGIEPIEIVEYDTSRQKLFVNENLALMVDKKPTAILIGEGDDVDLPETVISLSTQQDIQVRSKTGLATTVFRFDVSLTPAGSETIMFSSPLFMSKKTDDSPTFSPSENDRDRSVGKWFDFADERVSASYPDTRFNSAFNQATTSLVVQAFPVMFPEESHLASLSWKERMRVLLALIRSGCRTVAGDVVTELIDKSGVPDGALDTTIFSPMLLGILQYYEHIADAKISAEHLNQFRKHTNGLISSLRKEIGIDGISTHAESVMTDEPALEHYLVVKEGVLHDFEDQLWNLAALKTAHRFFIDLHDKGLAATIKEIIPKYQEVVIEKAKEIEHARWLRPSDPSAPQVEREILDVLSSTALLHITEVELEFWEFLCSKISKQRIVSNLWKFPQPNERYSSHLALRLAHYYTMNKQRELVESLLMRVLDFFTDDYHLPDFVDTRTYGGSDGDGSSVVAAADLILLLRDMIIFESDSNLIALAGIPSEWFTAKRSLVIDSLPTRNGPAHIEVGTSSNQHQIEIRRVQLPDEYDVHIPASVPISMVKAYGSSIVERASKVASPFLKIVPLSEEMVLTFHK